MSDLDFAQAKADIAQIVAIVKTVPENLQQVCFGRWILRRQLQ
jgi:hypothetical protein